MEDFITDDEEPTARTNPSKVAALAGAIAIGAVITFCYAPWPSLAFVSGVAVALYFTEREE